MLGFDSASVYWSRLVTRLNKSKAKTIRPKTVGLPLRHAREGVLLAVLLIGLATSCKPYMVISRHYVQDKRGNVLYVKDHSDTLLHPMRRKKFKSLQ
ncbi:MAG: hypothetical protein CMP48_25190 [Rickettsiales bacterium]|nr:hypothetical protein [Rickettsiales bacterium]